MKKNVLVILHNSGPEVVEMYDGKEITVKNGDNVFPKNIAVAFVGRTNRKKFRMITSVEGNKVVCPTCEQSAPIGNPPATPPADVAPKETTTKPVAASTETLPRESGQESKEPAQDSEESLDQALKNLPRKQLEELCEKRKIKIDGRWSDDKLKSLLKA